MSATIFHWMNLQRLIQGLSLSAALHNISKIILPNKESFISTMENELKQLIIDTLDLEDISVADIDSHAPLFNDGLGLDSIDALELGLAIRKKYNIKIDAEKEDVVKIFASVSTLADYIQAARD
jgi:acyl carrier protein